MTPRRSRRSGDSFRGPSTVRWGTFGPDRPRPRPPVSPWHLPRTARPRARIDVPSGRTGEESPAAVNWVTLLIGRDHMRVFLAPLVFVAVPIAHVVPATKTSVARKTL